ncbi:hypothetical protein PRIPAC_86565 [Pristionchus pacificus]|uniref:Uncharacterized protein n=1 Tax=Pristionchus pacificus TaxID=54126 RepID=A0A2A6BMV6_PRIPA|nr:hypothetical protein PRIPAC_86565 [Pristionchus pacificus]|eukprot:PDM67123.1 hypothetical protein PRIPAC_48540 [Pristionchus pacificus]
MHLANIVYLCYGIPCILIYILVIASILSMRLELSRGFVLIFIVDASVNLISYLNTWLNNRLMSEPALGFFYRFCNHSIIIPYVQEFLTGYGYYGQNVTSFLLTLDRFISIVFTIHAKGISLFRLRKLKFKDNLDRSFFMISFCIFIAQSVNIIIVLLFTYIFTIAYDPQAIIIINSIVLYTSDVFSLGPAMCSRGYSFLVPGPIRRRCLHLLSHGWNRPAAPALSSTYSAKSH